MKMSFQMLITQPIPDLKLILKTMLFQLYKEKIGLTMFQQANNLKVNSSMTKLAVSQYSKQISKKTMYHIKVNLKFTKLLKDNILQIDKKHPITRIIKVKGSNLLNKIKQSRIKGIIITRLMENYKIKNQLQSQIGIIEFDLRYIKKRGSNLKIFSGMIIQPNK